MNTTASAKTKWGVRAHKWFWCGQFHILQKKKKISLSENFFLPPDFPKGSEKDEYDRFKKISKWNVRC